ncbi:MAG: hypothetical protein ACKOHG_03280, partial [Planctomycetia bacterium]
MLGAVFEREVQAVPRARGLFVARAVYCGALLGIVATCWLVVTGTQAVTTAGDTARFGATLLRILAPLQLSLAMLAAAMTSTVAVTAEKDRRTLELLLISRLTDGQLVLGKLAGSLLRVLLLLLSAAPVFVIASLFGGVGMPQLARVFAVTAAAALVAASVATCVAFWKDTTFQSLAITTFALVAWVAAGEVVAGRFGPAVGAQVSPARAVFAALAPAGGGTLVPFLAVSAAVILLANILAVSRVRAWNTAQEIRRQPAADDASRAPVARRPARVVWDNPVLWRETCTRAHGKAMLLIRLAWLLLFGAAVAATASRLASAIGTTATATANPSGRACRASATMPATAAPKRSSHASRISSIALPWARVQVSRQSTGLSQTSRAGRLATGARDASSAVGCRRISWAVFQARTRLTARMLASRMTADDASRAPVAKRPARLVWDNPVLWRETCTR